MDHRNIVMSLAMILVALYTTLAEETATGFSDNEVQSISHQPQKRSALMSPDEDDVIYRADEIVGLPSYEIEAEPVKRGSLFRFGKRNGSMLRYGKRGGSLFRFGKRGTLFRFGKRNGSLLRFGRSGPIDDAVEEKRSLLRFGKRSGSGAADRLRELLSQYQYLEPAYEDIPQKRSDSFHWGKEGEK